MKVNIPDALKADIPQTTWGKILSATPVVMTVVATMLAGLASSEMTRAQYDRSLAAQQQAKAGDQWGYFQAKKLRGALQRNTLDIVLATTEVHPLEAAALPAPVNDTTLVALQRGELPAVAPIPEFDATVKAALEGIESQKPPPELVALLAQVKDETLTEAVRIANEYNHTFDAATKPVNLAIEQLEKLLAATPTAGTLGKSPVRDFTVARLRYNSSRYETEARLNQNVANLLELQVRKNNISAERHHNRSQRFFFGMLAAQAAVIISTFAIAAHKRNLLWSIAAAAGLAAIAFAIYVYVRV